MKITDIVSLARKKSKTNTTTFPDADMLLYIKTKLPQFQADIEEVNEDYMGSIEFRDLRATGTTGTYEDTGVTYLSREYNLPSDMIPRIKYVSAMLNGSDWIRLRQYDLNDVKIPFEEARILERFTNDEGIAGYEIFRGSLFLLTGEIKNAVDDGLKIWTYSFSSLPASIPVAGGEGDVEFDTYGIPETMQELFALALSMEWKSNQDVPVPFSGAEQNFYALYAKSLQSLKSMDRSNEITFERPVDRYDNGFNL